MLRKGLGFALAPVKIPVKELIIAVETACKLIGSSSDEAAALRADSVKVIKNARPPTSNVSREERQALKDLKQDDSIIAISADKGRAVVVMDTAEYETKMEALLSDSNTYEKLKKDPTGKYQRKVIEELKAIKKTGALDQRTYFEIYPTSAVAPKFYGLPKIHKAGVPLRPIVASRGSVTYFIARHVAKILAPLVGKSPRHIKNSADLVDKISQLTLDDDECLVSFDVSALFTSIPVDEALRIIQALLENDETLSDRTDMSPAQVTSLLTLCLKTTYFIYKGEFYIQKEGAAMGSPVSPIVANLYMEDFEEKAISTFPHQLKFWGRYVDDALSATKLALIDPLTTHLNSIDNHIQWTVEHQQDKQLPMLDAKMKIQDNGAISTSVYRKPTHTDQYLQFDSHQPLQHKLGVVRTLKHRAHTVCSTPAALEAELAHLDKVLSVSGYPPWALAASPLSDKAVPHPSTARTSRVRGHVSLPYVDGVTDILMRKFRQHGVVSHAKPANTIRQFLGSPKDKDPMDNVCGSVYHLRCEDCDDDYIGETGRPYKVRHADHNKDINSPVFQHLRTTGHKLADGKILDKDSRWFQRGVRESICIRSLHPSLNQDQGRHHLPRTYNSLLLPAVSSRSLDSGSATMQQQTDFLPSSQ